jgi:hypothetical protein
LPGTRLIAEGPHGHGLSEPEVIEITGIGLKAILARKFINVENNVMTGEVFFKLQTRSWKKLDQIHDD